jgi:hypothetical protein
VEQVVDLALRKALDPSPGRQHHDANKRTSVAQVAIEAEIAADREPPGTPGQHGIHVRGVEPEALVSVPGE